MGSANIVENDTTDVVYCTIENSPTSDTDARVIASGGLALAAIGVLTVLAPPLAGLAAGVTGLVVAANQFVTTTIDLDTSARSGILYYQDKLDREPTTTTNDISVFRIYVDNTQHNLKVASYRVKTVTKGTTIKVSAIFNTSSFFEKEYFNIYLQDAQKIVPRRFLYIPSLQSTQSISKSSATSDPPDAGTVYTYSIDGSDATRYDSTVWSTTGKSIFAWKKGSAAIVQDSATSFGPDSCLSVKHLPDSPYSVVLRISKFDIKYTGTEGSDEPASGKNLGYASDIDSVLTLMQSNQKDSYWGYVWGAPDSDNKRSVFAIGQDSAYVVESDSKRDTFFIIKPQNWWPRAGLVAAT